MEKINNIRPSNKRFKNLYINKSIGGAINIGIYDEGYESFTLKELFEIRDHINKIIIHSI